LSEPLEGFREGLSKAFERARPAPQSAAEVEARQTRPESGKSRVRRRQKENAFGGTSWQDRPMKITEAHFRHEVRFGLKL
jgi:hypothetical protein